MTPVRYTKKSVKAIDYIMEIHINTGCAPTKWHLYLALDALIAGVIQMISSKQRLRK